MMMIKYRVIDEILLPWVEAKGYQIQARDCDEEVRAFLIWSKENQQKVQIGITKIGEDLIEIGVFDGVKKRHRMTSSFGGLANLLDQAEHLAIQWLDEK